jgi:hypothetical protein
MPMTATPIFAQTPYIKSLSLLTTAACTTRAPTATASLAAANIVELTPVSTNGRRIDAIEVAAAANAIGGATVAGIIGIWAWDGTTAYLIDEIPVLPVPPSATAPAFTTKRNYSDLNLPAAFKLFASTSVTLAAATTALTVTVFGGDY